MNGGTRENEGGRHRARAISNDGVKGGGVEINNYESICGNVDDWKFVSSLGRLVVFRDIFVFLSFA